VRRRLAWRGILPARGIHASHLYDLFDKRIDAGEHPVHAARRCGRTEEQDRMNHFVLHDARDTVAVVVVEGVKAGMSLNGWIMDEDRMITIDARQDIPIGHKVALKDMAAGDTVIKYGIDMGKVVAPIKAGEHAHVHNIKTKRW
jgi:(2R)-sulfolactate sulfo-lyase subunit alpha